jgi:hypothetical protein
MAPRCDDPGTGFGEHDTNYTGPERFEQSILLALTRGIILRRPRLCLRPGPRENCSKPGVLGPGEDL